MSRPLLIVSYPFTPVCRVRQRTASKFEPFDFHVSSGSSAPPLGPKYHPASRPSYHFGCHVLCLPGKLKRNLGRHAEWSALAILGRCLSHILRRRIFTRLG